MSLACWISNGFSWMYFHFFNPSPPFFLFGKCKFIREGMEQKEFRAYFTEFHNNTFYFFEFFFFMSDQEVEFWCAFHPNQYVMSMV